MNGDPEHAAIHPSAVDPVDRHDYELARDDWNAERADRRREAEEDARLDRRDR